MAVKATVTALRMFQGPGGYDATVYADFAYENQWGTVGLANLSLTQSTTALMAAIRAAFVAFLVSTYGASFGLLDTVRIMGAPFEL